MEYPIIDTLTNAYIRNGWTGLEVIDGKNLIDIQQSERGGIDAQGNLVPGADVLWRTTVYTSVQPDQAYTLSCNSPETTVRIYYYTEDFEFINREGTFQILHFVTPNNCHYIKWTIYRREGYTQEFVNSLELQLEKGTEVTPYEPYKPTTTDIFSRTRLPLIRYFPHPVIDSLKRASDGSMTADDVQVLRHYLTKFGIGNIELGRFHAINPNVSDNIKEIDLEPIPIDEPIKEKKTGEEDLIGKTE